MIPRRFAIFDFRFRKSMRFAAKQPLSESRTSDDAAEKELIELLKQWCKPAWVTAAYEWRRQKRSNLHRRTSYIAGSRLSVSLRQLKSVQDAEKSKVLFRKG